MGMAKTDTDLFSEASQALLARSLRWAWALGNTEGLIVKIAPQHILIALADLEGPGKQMLVLLLGADINHFIPTFFPSTLLSPPFQGPDPKPETALHQLDVDATALMEEADKEAKTEGVDIIEPHHLLLALISQDDSFHTKQLLANHGISREVVALAIGSPDELEFEQRLRAQLSATAHTATSLETQRRETHERIRTLEMHAAVLAQEGLRVSRLHQTLEAIARLNDIPLTEEE